MLSIAKFHIGRRVRPAVCVFNVRHNNMALWRHDSISTLGLGSSFGVFLVCIVFDGRDIKEREGNALFFLIYFWRCTIWLWMYCKNVSDVHLPIFMMVVSSYPCNFRAIAPPARNEWVPTSSWWIACFSSINCFVAARTSLIMSFDVMAYQTPFSL